jgi:hypothetical protein
MAPNEVADPYERDDHHRSSGLNELVAHGSRAARPRSAPIPGRAKQGVTLRSSEVSSRDFYPVVSVLQAQTAYDCARPPTGAKVAQSPIAGEG